MTTDSLPERGLIQISSLTFYIRVWFFDHQKSPFLTTATFRQDSVFFRFPYLTFFFHTRALSDTLRRLRLMGLNRVCSMFVQCLFNVCSMLVQWLFNDCHHALCPPFSASSMNAAAVSVSSPMSFGRFAVIVLLATSSSHRMERSRGFHQSKKGCDRKDGDAAFFVHVPRL